MTVKRCPRCGTDNPTIYTRCLNCGAPLPEIMQAEGMRRYLVPAVTILAVLLVVLIVIIPAIHYTLAGGQVLSTAIDAATPPPVPQYLLGQPARAGDLQVTVTNAHPGDNQFNGNRFYTVTLTLQNYNLSDTYTLAAADFDLTDARGTYYSPLGIQSKTSYDLPPGSTGIAAVVYIVPQNAANLSLLYTFPATTVPGKDRTEVAFIL